MRLPFLYLRLQQLVCLRPLKHHCILGYPMPIDHKAEGRLYNPEYLAPDKGKGFESIKEDAHWAA
jgi:hypothetical protein